MRRDDGQAIVVFVLVPVSAVELVVDEALDVEGCVRRRCRCRRRRRQSLARRSLAAGLTIFALSVTVAVFGSLPAGSRAPGIRTGNDMPPAGHLLCFSLLSPRRRQRRATLNSREPTTTRCKVT